MFDLKLANITLNLRFIIFINILINRDLLDNGKLVYRNVAINYFKKLIHPKKCLMKKLLKISLLTINFKTSIKCRLLLESPVGDSQTKFSDSCVESLSTSNGKKIVLL